MIELICGDALEVLPTLKPQSVDAVITDPPYGLAFMGKRWDYDIPSVAVWEQCHRVLKDGGRLLSFGGTRTFHRIACNIEDAGFIIEDSIAWMHGQGFPKHQSKLKPAFEPIIVARKGSVSVLNIDECRIGSDAIKVRNNPCYALRGQNTRPNHKIHEFFETFHKGRYPANVVLDEEAAAELDAMSGISKSTGGTIRKTGLFLAKNEQEKPFHNFGDTGGASRFFYCAKASRSERGHDNGHPTVKPLSLMEWLVRLTCPEGGIVLDPFAGSGSTGVAALNTGRRFVGIEREPEYFAIASKRIAQAEMQPRLELAV